MLHVNCDEGVLFEDLDFGEGVHVGVLIALDADIRTSNKNVIAKLSLVMDPCVYHCAKKRPTINFDQAPLIIETDPQIKSIQEKDWFDYEDKVRVRHRKSTFFRWRQSK